MHAASIQLGEGSLNFSFSDSELDHRTADTWDITRHLSVQGRRDGDDADVDDDLSASPTLSDTKDEEASDRAVGNASQASSIASQGTTSTAKARVQRISRHKYIRTLAHDEVWDRAVTQLLALAFHRVDLNTASRQVLASIFACVTNDVLKIHQAHPPRPNYLTFESALYAACVRLASTWIPNLAQSPLTSRAGAVLGVFVSCASDRDRPGSASNPAAAAAAAAAANDSRVIVLPIPNPSATPSGTTAAALSPSHSSVPQFSTLTDSDPVTQHSCSTVGSGAYGTYAAVFDGHEGFDAAEACRTLLHHNLLRSDHYPHNMKQAMTEAYVTAHEHALKRAQFNNTKSGTCAVTALVLQGALTVGNVGDSRACLYMRDGSMDEMSMLHRCTEPKEREGVIARGGTVVDVQGTLRVNGICNVTRSIGFPPCAGYVLHTPHVEQRALTGEEDFLVLASPGLWDVVPPKEVGAIVRAFLEGKDKERVFPPGPPQRGRGAGCSVSPTPPQSPPNHAIQRGGTAPARAGRQARQMPWANSASFSETANSTAVQYRGDAGTHADLMSVRTLSGRPDSARSYSSLPPRASTAARVAASVNPYDRTGEVLSGVGIDDDVFSDVTVPDGVDPETDRSEAQDESLRVRMDIDSAHEDSTVFPTPATQTALLGLEATPSDFALGFVEPSAGGAFQTTEVEASLRALGSSQLPIEVALHIASQTHDPASVAPTPHISAATNTASMPTDADTVGVFGVPSLCYDLGSVATHGPSERASHRAVVHVLDQGGIGAPTFGERDGEANELTDELKSLDALLGTPHSWRMGGLRSATFSSLVHNSSQSDEAKLAALSSFVNNTSQSDEANASTAAVCDGNETCSLAVSTARASHSILEGTLGTAQQHIHLLSPPHGDAVAPSITTSMRGMRSASIGELPSPSDRCLNPPRSLRQRLSGNAAMNVTVAPPAQDMAHADALSSGVTQSMRVLYHAEDDSFSLLSLVDGGRREDAKSQPREAASFAESTDARPGDCASESAFSLRSSGRPQIDTSLAADLQETDSVGMFDDETQSERSRPGFHGVGPVPRLRFKTASVASDIEGDDDVVRAVPAIRPGRGLTSRGSKRRMGSWVSLGASSMTVVAPSTPRKPMTPWRPPFAFQEQERPHSQPIILGAGTSPSVECGMTAADFNNSEGSIMRRPTPPVASPRQSRGHRETDRVDKDELASPSADSDAKTLSRRSSRARVMSPTGRLARLTAEAAVRTSGELAEHLVQHAIARGARSGVSVVVLILASHTDVQPGSSFQRFS
eukprot:TRINITY_DN5681_c0_g3_i1.p1 TRINITY_DN5681_c0_g3~~TRINITY_DN5681_c0_g3_i1.p1  ORF type:complete len:1287 (+),score=226.01 TRINITY_DN5681_c0_g3_i1:186-4046(+)